MSKSKRDREAVTRWPTGEAPFRCLHCQQIVEPLQWGGRHRNHCPHCLYSRHVDDRRSGDRANACGGPMAPVGRFTRRTGEHVILHRCLSCGAERFNRLAADDNMGLARSLPEIEPRTAPGPDA
jgi:hypothetical protein